jgi:hypothetical protein
MSDYSYAPKVTTSTVEDDYVYLIFFKNEAKKSCNAGGGGEYNLLADRNYLEALECAEKYGFASMIASHWILFRSDYVSSHFNLGEIRFFIQMNVQSPFTARVVLRLSKKCPMFRDFFSSGKIQHVKKIASFVLEKEKSNVLTATCTIGLSGTSETMRINQLQNVAKIKSIFKGMLDYSTEKLKISQQNQEKLNYQLMYEKEVASSSSSCKLKSEGGHVEVRSFELSGSVAPVVQKLKEKKEICNEGPKVLEPEVHGIIYDFVNDGGAPPATLTQAVIYLFGFKY